MENIVLCGRGGAHMCSWMLCVLRVIMVLLGIVKGALHERLA